MLFLVGAWSASEDEIVLDDFSASTLKLLVEQTSSQLAAPAWRWNHACAQAGAKALTMIANDATQTAQQR